MASAGCERSVDSRVVCSVCLEPYTGRQPKLLPCFHTFCLPCLSQLAHTHHQGGDVASCATGEGDQKTGTPSVTITCPTCRNIVPVPPGGVKDFQSSFYVDADASPSSTDSNTQDAVDHDLQNKVQTQVKVVEAVLARLAEEGEQITRQRRALDHDIQTRYAAGLRHLADARDQSLISLRDAAQAAHDKLEADRMLAQMMHTKLTDLAGKSGRQKTTACKASGALLSDAIFRHFRQQAQKTEAKTYFSYSPSDSVTTSLIDSCTQFMGTVLPFGQASDLTVGTNKPREGVDAEYMDLLSNANLRHDVTTLLAITKTVQADFEKLQTHVSSVGADNARLLKELGDVQRNMTLLQSQPSNVQRDVTTLQADVEKLQTHVSSVEADNARLLKELGEVEGNMTLLQSQPSNVQHDVTTLQAEVEKLQTHVSSLDADNARLLKEVNALQENVTSGQSESSQLGSSVATVQKTLHMEIAALQDSLAKYSHGVAFHAWLGSAGRNQKTLILDRVETNVGGGYNPQTGIFTAPVSGTYIFMAATNPSGGDDKAVFNIMVEDKTFGRSRAVGGNSSTGHAIVEVAAGQRVWTESQDGEFYFGGFGFTYFSGLLVQAKLQ